MFEMPDILAKIVHAKSRHLASLSEEVTKIKDKALLSPHPLNFCSALSGTCLSIIAEIKKASPSAGIISNNFEPAKLAKAYCDAGADAISVLTEEDFFLGASADLKIAKDASSGIPILRKDFIFNELQIYESRMIGADSFLLICAILDEKKLTEFILLGRKLGMEALVETHDQNEIKKAINAGAKIIGINNRNLRTFEVSLDTSFELAKYLPDNIIKVSESGVKNADDCQELHNAGFDAVLIGETFMKSGLANLADTMMKFKGGINGQ